MNALIRTDVAIRPYALGDLGLLECLLGDPEMTVHLGGPESPEALRARHARYLVADEASGGIFTIEVGSEHEAVGWVGYWESSWAGEAVWECGWHVLVRFRGAGIATAATTLALGRMREHGVHRFVHAFPSVENEASNALCRRLGFEPLGEVDIEYPKGRMMRARNWRFDLDWVPTIDESPGRGTGPDADG